MSAATRLWSASISRMEPRWARLGNLQQQHRVPGFADLACGRDLYGPGRSAGNDHRASTVLLNTFADVTGTITAGTALTTTTTTAGQNALYTFSGTMGQQVSTNLSSSTYVGCNAVVVSIVRKAGWNHAGLGGNLQRNRRLPGLADLAHDRHVHGQGRSAGNDYWERYGPDELLCRPDRNHHAGNPCHGDDYHAWTKCSLHLHRNLGTAGEREPDGFDLHRLQCCYCEHS